MKRIIRQILRKLGVQIIKIKNTFPNHIENGAELSPITINYLLSKNGTVMFVDINKGRGLPINSYGSKGNHPFSFAASIAKNLSNEKQYNKIFEILSVYYKYVAPLNAGIIAGVSKKSVLHNYPAWAIVMPWDTKNMEEWKEHIVKSVIMENSREKSKAGIEKGWTWIGPVDNVKLSIEAKRLTNLLQSIQKDGYMRNDENDGDIVANLLVNEQNEWVWQSIGAQHRASVLSALDLKNIPIRVHKVIRRQDVEFWPNVLNKMFTVNEALNVFDMIFNASFSHITSNWDNYISEQKANDE